MQTPEIFYRWHQKDAPTFNATNAYSATWGSEFTADGTAYTCTACDGAGDQPPEVHESCDGVGCYHCDDGMVTKCGDCDGVGFIDCDRGYSCTWNAADLIAYIREHQAGDPDDTHGTVYVFEGERHGDGCDGEPLAVPTRVVETLTWSDLVAREESQ